MGMREHERIGGALQLAQEALQRVEAHTEAGHLRCPVCHGLGAAAGPPAHADDCALPLALAALAPLVPGHPDAATVDAEVGVPTT